MQIARKRIFTWMRDRIMGKRIKIAMCDAKESFFGVDRYFHMKMLQMGCEKG